MPEITTYDYEPRYKYPHMMPGDVKIWERFIAQNPAAFELVAYDVPVGIGTEMDTVVNPSTGGDVNRLYQRKIDVVGFTAQNIAIVEVKPRASTSAIGQVKGYAALYKRDYAPTLPLVPTIITDELLPEMDFLAKQEGVTLILA